MPFGKDDGPSAQEQTMSPQEIAALNQKNIANMMSAMPPLTAADARQEQQGLQNENLGTFVDVFNQMAQMGQGLNANNPMYQMSQMINPAGDGKNGGTPEPDPVLQLDKEEIMDPRPVVEPPPPVVEPTPDNGWGNVKNNQDAIAWALANGDITPEEAKWLGEWSRDSGHKNDMFVTGGGGFRDWDVNNSGLTGQNKGIVNRFRNSISGNYTPRSGGGQPQAATAATYAPGGMAGGYGMPTNGAGYVANGFLGQVAPPSPRGKRSTF